MAANLAPPIAEILFAAPRFSQLRAKFGFFQVHTIPRVHMIQFTTRDTAAAFVTACEQATTVNVVYAALQRYATLLVIPYDTFRNAPLPMGVVVTMDQLEREIDWRVQIMAAIVVDTTTNGTTGVTIVDGLLQPSWCQRPLSEYRDDKTRLFLLIESVEVAMREYNATELRRLVNQVEQACPTACEACGSERARICGACLCVCFCSVACQRASHAAHRLECAGYRKWYNVMKHLASIL